MASTAEKLPHKRKNDTELTIVVPNGESGDLGVDLRVDLEVALIWG